MQDSCNPRKPIIHSGQRPIFHRDLAAEQRAIDAQSQADSIRAERLRRELLDAPLFDAITIAAAAAKIADSADRHAAKTLSLDDFGDSIVTAFCVAAHAGAFVGGKWTLIRSEFSDQLRFVDLADILRRAGFIRSFNREEYCALDFDGCPMIDGKFVDQVFEMEIESAREIAELTKSFTRAVPLLQRESAATDSTVHSTSPQGLRRSFQKAWDELIRAIEVDPTLGSARDSTIWAAVKKRADSCGERIANKESWVRYVRSARRTIALAKAD